MMNEAYKKIELNPTPITPDKILFVLRLFNEFGNEIEGETPTNKIFYQYFTNEEWGKVAHNVKYPNFCVKSWDNLQSEIKRNGVDGAFIDAKSPIEFCFEAKHLLHNHFKKYGVKALAACDIYIRDRIEWNKYDLLKRFDLDFTSYSWTKTTVSVGSRQNDLQSMLATKGKIMYDIPLSDLQTHVWDYDRISVNESVSWRIENREIIVDYESVIPLYHFNEELSKDTVQHIISDQNYEYRDISNDKGGYLFEANDDIGVNLVLDFKLRELEGDEITVIVQFVRGGNVVLYQPNQTLVNQIVHVKSSYFGLLRKGDRIRLKIKVDNKGTTIYYPIGEGVIRLEFVQRPTSINVSVFKPGDLLNRMLYRMAGDNRYNGVIEFENADYDIMMACAESMRGWENPQIHTSFEKFMQWMRSYGYEAGYAADTLILKKRDSFFNKDVEYLEYNESNSNKLELVVAKEHIYSSIEIGYERKDYSNVNGKYEFNGTHSYTTGVTQLDNKLSLISPYRADCYGIEFLIQDREAKTKDNKADNDLFVVALVKDRGIYKTYRGGYTISGNIPNSSVFNVPLSPYHMVKMNESLIGVSTKIVEFCGSTNNALISILDKGNLMWLNGNIVIDKKLFSPIIAKFVFMNEYTNIDSYDLVNGTVQITYLGEVYKGYVKSMQINYNRNKTSECEMYLIG